jgi:hypothetical protein
MRSSHCWLLVWQCRAQTQTSEYFVRQALMGCFVSAFPMNAAYNRSWSPIVTLDDKDHLWTNPRHLTSSSMVHIRMRDSIAELLYETPISSPPLGATIS